MLFYATIVCVMGFYGGQQFSEDPNAIVLRDEIISLFVREPSSKNANAASTKATDESPTSSSNNHESDLLDEYLEEFENKKFLLPTIRTTNNDYTAQREIERRKHFAEFIVHPILLVSGSEEYPDDSSETLAIAVDLDSDTTDQGINGIVLAQDLLREIALHDSITKVTIFLVSPTASKKQNGCPKQLQETSFDIPSVECFHINPQWGIQQKGYIDKEFLPDDGFDVSIVLSGCDTNDQETKDRFWEKELYHSTDSMVSTCAGKRRKTGRSLNAVGLYEQHLRIDAIEHLFDLEKWGSESSYTQVVDYDVQGLTMAVGFHKNMDDGVYKWHLNEAGQNLELSWRLKGGIRDDSDNNESPSSLRYFEAPDMTTLQFPPKASADSYCRYLDDYDEMEGDEYCEHGYDPEKINIPLSQVYVAKSGSGENAGRGVFTSVDLLEKGTMIGMETNVHSVFYPPMSKALVNQVVDMKVYNSYDEKYEDDDDDDDDDDDEDEYLGGDSPLMSTAIYRSLTVYAEAYGFDDNPWGIAQTSVYSNVLTFVNHGCNGTANIGTNIPGVNEFTIDTSDPSTFSIPEDFKVFNGGEYSPHKDRTYFSTITTTQVEHAPILKGNELFDNYMGFGGDHGFLEQIEDLKRDCTGALGTVERHQLMLKKAKSREASGSGGSDSGHTTNSDPLQKRRRSKDQKKDETSSRDEGESVSNDRMKESSSETLNSDEL